MPQVRWQPKRETTPTGWPMPPLGTALWRGLLCRCPSCGKTPLFNGYITVVTACTNCGAPLGSARADDAPPYFTILVVGHIVIPLLVLMQRDYDPSTLALTAVFVPMTIVLVLGLLRPIKGATVGLMLRLNMMKPDSEIAPPPVAKLMPGADPR
jgi:uncharacterized protein (DUF983 family)